MNVIITSPIAAFVASLSLISIKTKKKKAFGDDVMFKDMQMGSGIFGWPRILVTSSSVSGGAGCSDANGG